jgi:hypothetical protein
VNSATKQCAGCGHPFHPAGTCARRSSGKFVRTVVLQRNAAGVRQADVPFHRRLRPTIGTVNQSRVDVLDANYPRVQAGSTRKW